MEVNSIKRAKGYAEVLPEPNRTYVLTFIRNKQLSGLSERTIRSYAAKLSMFLRAFDKRDAKELTQMEIEDWFLQHKGEYHTKTLVHFRICVSLLLQQIHDKRTAEQLLEHIHFKVPITQVREDELLTDDEVKRMISVCTAERDRALIAVLHSSGCRIGEIIGINLGDISINRIGASLHVNGKTGERDVDIFVGVPELKAWINVHPLRHDKTAPLFVTTLRGTNHRRMSSSAIRMFLRRTAVRAGIPPEKAVNPHAFRHKRATDLADHLTIADMEVMFGWTKGSNMPSVYVHSSRKKVQRKLAEISGLKIPEQQAPTTMVRQCQVCGCVNAGDAIVCTACGSPLNPDIRKQIDKIEDWYINEYKKE